MPKPKKPKAKSTRSSVARRGPKAAEKAARRSARSQPKKAATARRPKALAKAPRSTAKPALTVAKASSKAAKPSSKAAKAPARRAKPATTLAKRSKTQTAPAPARAKAQKPTPKRPATKPLAKAAATLAPVRVSTPAAKPLLLGDVVKVRSMPPQVTVKAATPRRAPDDRTLARVRDLGRRLGYGALHPELEQLAKSALAGQDALGIVQHNDDAAFVALAAAPELREPCFFVSPSGAALRAIEARALELGVPSLRLGTSSSPAERTRALGRIAKGGPLLVLTGAAELRSRDLAQACSRIGVGLLVVDEAHVASAFGHELRPSVAEIAEACARLGQPPVIALTRPVPAAARAELIERLRLRSPAVFELPLVREHVALGSHVARGEVRQARLVELLQQLSPPGVIFCALPHDVDSVYGALGAMGIAAHRHHAGLAPPERARELEAWSSPARRAILVATSGFSSPSGVLGLGEEEDPNLAGFGRFVPRRDVRFVIHSQAPASLDQYLREIALAGRDGEPADAILLYESAHRSLNDALLAQQRFRPQHPLDLSRALEAAATDGKPLTVEALALSSGQSRRTMERLTALLADAGLIEKVSNWVRPVAPAGEIAEGCRRLSARLEALRAEDARRLEAVTDYAEGNSCRREALSRAFGVASSRCGRCSVCAPRPFDRASRDAGAPPIRRPAVQSFSVGPVLGSESGGAVLPGPTALTAKLGEFQVP